MSATPHPQWPLRIFAWIGFAFISMNIGLGKSEPWSAIPFARVLWAFTWFLSFVALFTNWGERIGAFLIRVAGSLPGRAAILLWIAGLMLLSWKKFSPLGYEFPIAHLVLCASALPFLRRTWLPFALNIALLLASILHFPLNYHRSDMLKVIELSLDNWTLFKPIYVYHALDWPSIAHYFPLIFVSHLPAWTAGIDLRWNTVLWRLVWFIPLYFRIYGRPKTKTPPWADSLLFILLLNPYWTFRHELYFEIYLCFIVGSWLLPRAGDALLGLSMWTRNFVILFLPFLLLRKLRDRRWREIAALLFGFALGAVMVYRFFLPEDWRGWWRANNFFITIMNKPSFQGDYGLTVAPFLFKAEIQKYSMYLQFFGGALLGLFALRFRRIPELVFATAGIAWFLGLNVMFWNYFLISQVLWIGIGLLIRPELFRDNSNVL